MAKDRDKQRKQQKKVEKRSQKKADKKGKRKKAKDSESDDSSSKAATFTTGTGRDLHVYVTMFGIQAMLFCRLCLDFVRLLFLSPGLKAVHMEWVTQMDQGCPRFENAKAVDAVRHSVCVMGFFSRSLAVYVLFALEHVCNICDMLHIVTCVCYVIPNQGSNSPNPITCITCPERKEPCRPWLRGDHLDPKKNVCKVCYTVFKLGAYKRRYKTFKKLRPHSM